MGRKTVVKLQGGKKVRICLTKSINIVVVNEMKPLIDGQEFSASYNWEWLADRILEHHKIPKEALESYLDFVVKVKHAYHRVKNPEHARFNPQIDTFFHELLGSRVVKLSHKSPEKVRNLVTEQKERRIINGIEAHNRRLQSRNEMIGFSGTLIEFKED